MTVRRPPQNIQAQEAALRKLIAATHRRGIATARLGRSLALLNQHRRADLAKLEASTTSHGVTSARLVKGGPDWYSGDGQVDVATLAHSGLYDVAIRKLTEGLAYIDPGASRDLQQIRRYPQLHRGLYHFAHPAWSAVGQARHFVSTAKAVGLLPTDLLIVDVEVEDGQGVDGWRDEFAGEVHRLAPRNTQLLYTAELWRQWLAREGLPCWVAALNGQRGVASPLGLQGHVLLHQLSFTARIAGGRGLYDLSVVP